MEKIIKDNILVKREVEVIITPQAQRILSMTKYTVEEFIDWSLETQKLSLGGNNVTIFLERMYEKEAKKDVSSYC